MSTTMATKESVTRKWYILDAAGKPMGKTAALAADLLRGKLKTDYTPHVDCGDYVIIINAKDAVLTGKKLEQKYYRTHSGYPGGLKETQYKTLMAKKPELAMRLAVRGMLQKNTIAEWQLKRLRIYAGAEHDHAGSEARSLGSLRGGKRIWQPISARSPICTAPDAESPPSPAFTSSPTAAVSSPSTAVISTITSVSKRSS